MTEKISHYLVTDYSVTNTNLPFMYSSLKFYSDKFLNNAPANTHSATNHVKCLNIAN